MTTATPNIDYVFLLSSPEARTCLRPLKDDPMDFVSELTFNVMGWDFSRDADDDLVLGTIHAQRVLLGQALNLQVHWADVADATSQDLANIHAIMYGEGHEYTPEFENALETDANGSDLLYVSSDEILDATWGPSALHVLEQHYSDCGFIVVGVSGLVNPDSAEEESRAESRCDKLQDMGFTQYLDSPYFFRNTAYVHGALPKHLQLPDSPTAVAA